MKKITFEGKRVLLTGASTGIGRALSREFARRGAHLALGSLPREAGTLKAWAQELTDTYGIQTWTFPIDLINEDGPENLYREVKEKLGDIYALVNNAGSVVYGRFWESSWEHQSKMFRLNLYVPMRLMHLFIPDMIKNGGGVIFNTSSVSALQPTPFQSVYGATKAGLLSLSRGIRAELRRSGVHVCALNPPYIDTDLLKTQGYPPDLRFYTISPKKKPEWVAAKALEAFESCRMSYIPGAWSNIIHNLLVRLSPVWLVDEVSRFFLQGWKNPIDRS
ncbi:MAG TPA: SDR family NAD(P)-dependent oxidoreductase [Deltaproteobacteria bacterium]|nr:SDR family NAD(P)-dependent oxidoreductase [Deltaproteobacteria bacterium]HPJ94786.1 SDR family NAD(P)-dependent oxidoreductase [Deltaproteobacteria bacterium]HPR52672.1 SDR family NAD(P)-dependent oxidoreductase [Deltaproteobacteria bacterium]